MLRSFLVNNDVTSQFIKRSGYGEFISLKLFQSPKTLSFFKDAVLKLSEYKFYTFEWNTNEGSSLIHSVTPDQIDMFSVLSSYERDKLRNDPIHFWMFDYSMEGTSYKHYDWFKNIHDSAKKHDIPFYKIFFISSNIYEEAGYNQWLISEKISEKINIVTLNLFSTWFMQDFFKEGFTIDQTVDYIRQNKKKYFLSLNRRCRPYRIITTYLLWQSKMFSKGLVSADIPRQDAIENAKFILKDLPDHGPFEEYLSKLPFILDRSDFEVNWAWDNPKNLFAETLFSAVSETSFEDFFGTSLFYSEKSFKPMQYNHPVLIFGQPGLNTHLETVGFKNYSKYFNLEFDIIPNHLGRLVAQLKELERVTDLLDILSTEEKIEWVLQDQDTLLYNKKQLTEQTYNIAQVEKLLSILKMYKDYK
jgi:hypothetical protein